MRLKKIQSTGTEAGYRTAKSTSDSVTESISISPFGIESVPVNGVVGAVSSSATESMLLGVVMRALMQLESGETALIARTINEVKSSVHCKVNGEVVINDGTDYAVKFDKLKKEFDDLVSYVNDIKTALTGATAGTYPVVYPAPLPAAGCTADIKDAKAEIVRI